jgi:hypothetical protein
MPTLANLVNSNSLKGIIRPRSLLNRYLAKMAASPNLPNDDLSKNLHIDY